MKSPVALRCIAAASPDLAQLEEKIGYQFMDTSLLEKALTWTQAKADFFDFEGDRLLGIIVMRELRMRYPRRTKDELMGAHQQCVRNTQLKKVARRIGLYAYVPSGQWSSAEQFYLEKDSADLIEAIIGAAFDDGNKNCGQSGFEMARRVVVTLLAPELAAPEFKVLFIPPEEQSWRIEENLKYNGNRSDPCFKLSLIAAKEPVFPTYDDVELKGAEQSIVRAVRLGDLLLAYGSGATAFEADRDAARNAIANIQDGKVVLV